MDQEKYASDASSETATVRSREINFTDEELEDNTERKEVDKERREKKRIARAEKAKRAAEAQRAPQKEFNIFDRRTITTLKKDEEPSSYKAYKAQEKVVEVKTIKEKREKVEKSKEDVRRELERTSSVPSEDTNYQEKEERKTKSNYQEMPRQNSKTEKREHSPFLYNESNLSGREFRESQIYPQKPSYEVNRPAGHQSAGNMYLSQYNGPHEHPSYQQLLPRGYPQQDYHLQQENERSIPQQTPQFYGQIGYSHGSGQAYENDSLPPPTGLKNKEFKEEHLPPNRQDSHANIEKKQLVNALVRESLFHPERNQDKRERFMIFISFYVYVNRDRDCVKFRTWRYIKKEFNIQPENDPKRIFNNTSWWNDVMESNPSIKATVTKEDLYFDWIDSFS